MSPRITTLFAGTLLACLVGCGKDGESPKSDAPTARKTIGADSGEPTKSPAEVDPPTNGKTNGAGATRETPPDTETPKPQTDLLTRQGRVRTIRVGKHDLEVWIANTDETRYKGLMHVESLSDEQGMLFIYPSATRPAFYMRNTLIDLDLAYVAADGTIKQILHMRRLDQRSRPSKHLARFVLEVNKGWFARHDVTVGTRIPEIQDLEGF